MNENWVNDLRGKLDRSEKAVPEKLWDEINSTLEAKRKGAARRKRIVLWLGTVSAAAAIALIIMLSRDLEQITTLPSGKEETLADLRQEPATSDKENGIAEKPDFTPYEEAPAESENEEVHSSKGKGYLPDNKTNVPTQNSTVKQRSQDSEKDGEPAIGTVNDTKDEVVKPEQEVQSETTDKNPPTNKPDISGGRFQNLDGSWDFPDMENEKKRGNGRFSVGISGANGLASSAEQNGYCAPVLTSMLEGRTDDEDQGIMLQSVSDESVTSETRHRIPIRASLSVRYAITEKLSVESGLTFSSLTSDFTSDTEGSQYRIKRKTQYLGLPLNLNYSLVKRSGYDLYLTGGGMAEKCLGGSSKTSWLSDGEVTNSETKSFSIKPLQFSVNAGAGIQANIGKTIGIYAEPGLSYYFKNGENAETLYSEKPLNFNLEVGIRFNLK